jgi:hypothetical protein
MYGVRRGRVDPAAEMIAVMVTPSGDALDPTELPHMAAEVGPAGSLWNAPSLSWAGVRDHAWQSVRRSWIAVFGSTVSIAVLSVVIPWGFVDGFSESGWDEVTGGSATWALVAIPAWLLLIAVGYVLRAPVSYASKVVASYDRRLSGVQNDLKLTRDELARERAAAPLFGDAPIPQRVEQRLIRLADLPPGIWLTNMVIERCDIVGPGKLLMSGGNIHDNHLYGRTSETFIAADDLGPHMEDSIVIFNCDVTGCRLHNLTLVGLPGTIANIRAATVEGGSKDLGRTLDRA